jgi:hypothetical protein
MVRQEIEFLASIKEEEIHGVIDAAAPVIIAFLKVYARTYLRVARVLAPIVEPLMLAIASILALVEPAMDELVEGAEEDRAALQATLVPTEEMMAALQPLIERREAFLSETSKE